MCRLESSEVTYDEDGDLVVDRQVKAQEVIYIGNGIFCLFYVYILQLLGLLFPRVSHPRPPRIGLTASMSCSETCYQDHQTTVFKEWKEIFKCAMCHRQGITQLAFDDPIGSTGCQSRTVVDQYLVREDIYDPTRKKVS